MTTEPPPDLHDALRIACRRAGLDPAGARLIHHYANAVFLLPRPRVVARLGSGETRARTSVAVTRALAAAGFPATAPLELAQPIRVAPHTVVTFWRYYPQPPRPAFTAAQLARLLHQLHQLPDLGIDLPTWTPLRSLESALRDEQADQLISAADRDWLLRRVTSLRAELATLHYPLGCGLIHGDAWAGNLLADGPRHDVVLGDWDSVCHGPREVDLVPTWHATIRYGRPRSWAREFAETYGHDLARWDGFDQLCRMRDLVQLTGPLRRGHTDPAIATALRQRLTSIKAGDTSSAWRTLHG